MDVASRGNKSYLGINAQFFNKKTQSVCIRNLSILEIETRHTADNLFLKIRKLLGEFNIDILSVICFTSDNGKNIVATGKNLQRLQRQKYREARNSDIKPKLQKILSEPHMASIFRCIEHTVQLGIQDAYNVIFGTNNFLTRIRSVVKSLKSSELLEQVLRLKLKVPKIDCVTRWHSLYKMMKELKDQKDVINHLSTCVLVNTASKIRVSQEEWEVIDKYLQAFLPVYNFAISVESNFISCGDLFIQFLITISKLEEIENSNDFVPILKLHITKRLNESIKENKAFF